MSFLSPANSSNCQESTWRKNFAEEGEASRPSPTASFKKRTTPLPLLQLANLVARKTILASHFRRIHTPDTVDTLTRPIIAQSRKKSPRITARCYHRAMGYGLGLEE